MVQEMADALANIDGLRLLAPPPRRPPFPEQVTTYLEAEFPVVEPRAQLVGVSGSPYRTTAAAGTDERKVFIQTAAGQNVATQRSAVEPIRPQRSVSWHVGVPSPLASRFLRRPFTLSATAEMRGSEPRPRPRRLC